MGKDLVVMIYGKINRCRFRHHVLTYRTSSDAG